MHLHVGITPALSQYLFCSEEQLSLQSVFSEGKNTKWIEGSLPENQHLRNFPFHLLFFNCTANTHNFIALQSTQVAFLTLYLCRTETEIQKHKIRSKRSLFKTIAPSIGNNDLQFDVTADELYCNWSKTGWDSDRLGATGAYNGPHLHWVTSHWTLL